MDQLEEDRSWFHLFVLGITYVELSIVHTSSKVKTNDMCLHVESKSKQRRSNSRPILLLLFSVLCKRSVVMFCYFTHTLLFTAKRLVVVVDFALFFEFNCLIIRLLDSGYVRKIVHQQVKA